MELQIKGKLDAAQERVDALQSKVARVTHCSSKLRDDRVLAQRARELEVVRTEHQVRANFFWGGVGGGFQGLGVEVSGLERDGESWWSGLLDGWTV